MTAFMLVSACRAGFDFQDNGTPDLEEVGDENCGDGVLLAAENCDDGNTVNGDGCSARCNVEQGYRCADAPSECTVVVQVQSGVATIAGGATDTVVDVPSPVAPDHSVLFFNVTHNGLDPDNGQVTGRLSDDGSAVIFERPNLGSFPVTIDIQWSVVESQEWLVQRGRTLLTDPATTLDVPLPTPVADVTRAFATATARMPGSSYGRTDWALVRLLDESTLQFDRTPSACCDATVDWQVVEFVADTDALVQRGGLRLETLQTSASVTLPQQASMDRSFMLFTQNVVGTIDLSAADAGVRGDIRSDTELYFERHAGAEAIDVSWFVVTWAQVRAQHYSASFANDVDDRVIELDPRVDRDPSVSFLPGMMRQGSSPYLLDSRMGLCWFTTRIENDGADLRIHRGDTGEVGEAFATVLDFR